MIRLFKLPVMMMIQVVRVAAKILMVMLRGALAAQKRNLGKAMETKTTAKVPKPRSANTSDVSSQARLVVVAVSFRNCDAAIVHGFTNFCDVSD